MELTIRTDYKEEISFTNFCLQNLSPLLSPCLPVTKAKSSQKTCQCKKSRCLKLYCECFASNQFCTDCGCSNCFNIPTKNFRRQSAIENILDRNPRAFEEHGLRCNCSKTSCLKGYCVCFHEKQACSSECACISCRNPYNEP